MGKKAKIAVVLSGCGVYDGSEIHEAVLTLLAIDRNGATYECFAPNVAQHHVINHLTGQPANEARNVLVESARIARGQVRDLAAFDAKDFDAVIFPGGFGAAKNLSSFAFDGPECSVEPNVAKAVRAMHAAKKPIGALCIAPAVIAKVLGQGNFTIGDDAGVAGALEKMGVSHQKGGHGQAVVDSANRIVTSPCYMLESTIAQIADGADAAVKAVLKLAS